jgi:hypothetical protein
MHPPYPPYLPTRIHDAGATLQDTEVGGWDPG